MDLLHALWLALLQGLTEFLPISSSAHLVLVPVLLGWPDQGLAFDVGVHVGTLLAVLAYFRGTVAALVADAAASLTQRRMVGEGRLAAALVVATLPVVVAGLLFGNLAEGALRAPLVIAAANIGFGLLLWVADRRGGGTRSELEFGLREALWVGLAQALAIIPGTSRSGVTMMAGLFLGASREAAARFSFLLAIPTIALAGAWQGLKLLEPSVPVEPVPLLLGLAVSAVSAYACIAAFLALVRRIGMLPFVIYRLVLGGVLLVVFW